MVANQELLPFLLLVRFDLLSCHHRHTPGICSFVCSWWSTHHPQVCRKRRFPIPELLINLIYVFWGYIFSSAKLISIKFFQSCMHNSYQASSIFCYWFVHNNPAAISMSNILGNNCYWNTWHPLYIAIDDLWLFGGFFNLAADNLRSDYHVQPFWVF